MGVKIINDNGSENMKDVETFLVYCLHEACGLLTPHHLDDGSICRLLWYTFLLWRVCPIHSEYGQGRKLQSCVAGIVAALGTPASSVSRDSIACIFRQE
jgi:hypothetical protein